MKKRLGVCLIGAALVGCGGPGAPVPVDAPSTAQTITEAGEAVTFVSLKVPNMH